MVSKSQSFTCIPINELRSKECIDIVLKPLIDYIDIPINGLFTSNDIFHTTTSMAVDKKMPIPLPPNLSYITTYK